MTRKTGFNTFSYLLKSSNQKNVKEIMFIVTQIINTIQLFNNKQ